MKVKLDENLGSRGKEVFERHGHDVRTVPDQELQAAQDRQLIEICRREERCLISLDLDFSNPMVFPPPEYGGIAVLRLSVQAGLAELLTLAERLAVALHEREIQGHLWIVQDSGIREYQG